MLPSTSSSHAFRAILLLPLAVAAAAQAPSVAAAVAVEDLRCEYLNNPLGIDATAPRLSWIVQSEKRGDKQTAYQVLASSSPEKLAHDQGDLWDSGQVNSDQSIQLPYAGKPLAAQTPVWWKVRVWDRDGAPSAWSDPAHWSMGLLTPADWKGAQWIGLESGGEAVPFTGANWIWFPEGEPAKAVDPRATRFFRHSVDLPQDRAIAKATLRFTGDNHALVFVNGKSAGKHDSHATAAQVDVTAMLHGGENVVAASVANDGAAPNPAGFVAKLEVEFDRGEPLAVSTDATWKTTDQQPSNWMDPAFDDAAWKPAKQLGALGAPPWNQVALNQERRLPARYLRKRFALDKDVRRATVSFSGLGVSELYVNGKRIGDAVLSPGMTEYPKRVLYVTYDVTDHLRRGDNALGVILGNGRYYSPRSEAFVGMKSYGYPKLLLNLSVEHNDGSVTHVVSDPSWKLSIDGPIVANNEYDGEEYDAQKEFGDWSAAAFDDSTWRAVEPAPAPGGQVRAQMIDPIRVTETLKPKSVAEVRPGVFVFDMGQNLVGWCRIKVAGSAGQQVVLRHAETLQPDGNLYMANLRAAKVTDVYSLRGGGTEIWEPRFTYHGFRFVEVTGFPGKPTLESIEGRVVHDEVRRTGRFACSKDLINQIFSNVVWGVRGNYRSVPTDCPQRDERQGWMGDRGEESRGEMYIYDNAALLSKWVQDMADSQKDTGSVPDVCPAHWPFYTDNVTWPSSTVLVPNSLYRQFGDSQIVARHYDSAKRWVDYMLTFVKDGITERDQYGDWCVPPEDPHLIHSKDPARQTSKPLLATAYLYYDLRVMQRFATMLGKTEDAARFAKTADDMKHAFNDKFFDAKAGQYDNGSQTSCVLPLAFGLAPDGQRQRVFEHLIHKIIDETHGHIGTGLIGGQFLNRVLSDNGRCDVAYTIATQTEYPSWGYMIAKGATTVWELWNGDTADPAMNSGNHVMLVGDFVPWVFEYLAGIRPDEQRPGFKHIIMRPQPVGDLQWVKCSLRSPYGVVKSEWQKNGREFAWQIVVPPNAEATVYVPAASADRVTEGGQPLAQANGVKLQGVEDGAVVLQIGSGDYKFQAR
jgi:alpha-L-rhamnosidase